jgi:MFS superfamily sulfate permease-like transporter
MLEGIRMMSQSPWLGAALLILTLLLLARSRIPAMFILLLIGVALAVVEQPALLTELAAIQIAPHLPSFSWPTLTWNDLWIDTLFLALPQLPLTFGNALISITEENNRLFPDRPVTEKRVAFSTGLMNLWSSALGGIPMCHGAGGMAGHVQFGARTGGSSVMLGVLLLAIGFLLADSVALLFRLFPTVVLGVILFLAGVQLALNSKEIGGEKTERFVVLTTAAFAVWNVGIAVLFGIFAFHAAKRGWMKL